MSRFDQDPTRPYGTCKDCPVTFATRDEMHEHLSVTHDAGKGHTGLPSNPTRAERIARAVQHEADDALDQALTEFIDGLYDVIHRDGITTAEVTAAVATVFAEADWAGVWAEYVEENADDEDEEPAERPDGIMPPPLDGLGVSA